MVDAGSKRVVAYVPFKTFLSAIESLEHGIPHQIDTSVWPTYSGAIQSQLLGAFRFLRLIDDAHKPTTVLKNLVDDRANRKAILRKILESSYAKIVDLGLTKLSPKQFDEAVREYGMTGETHKKVVSFFLQAAKYAELPISSLLGRKVRAGGTRRRKAEHGAMNGVTLGAASGAGSKVTSKTITLRNGGSLTVSLEGNVLEMGTEERRLIFGLIDRLQGYERHKETTSE